MIGRLQVVEADLHGFIDGELDGERHREVEQVVRDDAALSNLVALYRADKERLARAYADVLEQPLPPAWLSRIASQPRSRSSVRSGVWMALAASLVLAVAAALTYRVMPASPDEPIVAEALSARADATAPQAMLATDSPAKVRNADRLVAAALAMRVKAPDLARMGYTLTGVRTYGGVPGGKAVELVYRSVQNQAFTLYLRHPSSPPRFDQFKRDGLRICIWQDDVLGTVMAGQMSAAEMQRLASLAYMGLES